MKALANHPNVNDRDELMVAEAKRIVAASRDRDLSMRVLGSVAIKLHCPKYGFLTSALGRNLADVDFAAYGSDRDSIEALMRGFGYEDQPVVTALFGNQRLIWENKTANLHADIFFDRLEMNHPIDFRGRLELGELTIPLEELLLEKLQIVKINDKDIVDTIMLLREHQIGNASPETIDLKYIAKLLSNEWGFYYTVRTNLDMVKNSLATYQELTQEDRGDVQNKVESIIAKLESEPKTLAWKLRARVGTKTKWYNDVEEVNR